MSEIKSVEYRQGSSEFGADFILTAHDSLLNDNEYIGVIVKQGPIRQNQDEIERQIKECQIPKRINGGKKEISINQIWIVTNDKISENAKKKIKHEYSNQNIKFIWDEKLIKLTDDFYPEFWEDVDRNVSNYLSELDIKIRKLNRELTILDGIQSEVYIDQDILRIDTNEIKKFRLSRKSKKEKLTAVIKKQKAIFVEAPMGYGKSRLLRQTAIELTEVSNFNENKILPVYFSFRELADDYQKSLDKVINFLVKDRNILLDGLSIVLFIDSVDEVKLEDADKVTEMVELIKSAMGYENVKLVFASRPFRSPVLDELLDKHLVRYELVQLTMDKVVKLVEKMCLGNVFTTKLKDDLNKSDLFRSLPRSPISAILLGRVLNSDARELPSTLPELYSKYLDLVLGRWELQKGNASEKEYETNVILVRLIAKFMLENDLPEIGIGDAKLIIKEYISEREEGYSSKQLLAKTDSIFSRLASCDQILIVNEDKNQVNFRHRSFLEFMYADLLFTNDGKNAVLENPFDVYWGQVNYFYLGRLKDCPDQLDRIISNTPIDEALQLNKIFSVGSYMLAAYQSPYKTIIRCLRISLIEAAEFYSKICSDPKSSSFGNFPKIQLLALTTMLVKRNFEYDFFKKALLEVETELLLSNDFDDVTVTAAFYVSAIRAGLGCNDAFENLLDATKDSLPDHLTFGIFHVSDDSKLINDAIKKLQKNVRRKIKHQRHLVDALHETPMIDLINK